MGFWSEIISPKSRNFIYGFSTSQDFDGMFRSNFEYELSWPEYVFLWYRDMISGVSCTYFPLVSPFSGTVFQWSRISAALNTSDVELWWRRTLATSSFSHVEFQRRLVSFLSRCLFPFCQGNYLTYIKKKKY